MVKDAPALMEAALGGNVDAGEAGTAVKRPFPNGSDRVGEGRGGQADDVLYTWAGPEIAVPETRSLLQPSLSIVPLQRGCDIGTPRNLAKSVTVE